MCWSFLYQQFFKQLCKWLWNLFSLTKTAQSNLDNRKHISINACCSALRRMMISLLTSCNKNTSNGSDIMRCEKIKQSLVMKKTQASFSNGCLARKTSTLKENSFQGYERNDNSDYLFSLRLAMSCKWVMVISDHLLYVYVCLPHWKYLYLYSRFIRGYVEWPGLVFQAQKWRVSRLRCSKCSVNIEHKCFFYKGVRIFDQLW